MRMRSYLKKKELKVETNIIEEDLVLTEKVDCRIANKKKTLLITAFLLFAIPLFVAGALEKGFSTISLGSEGSVELTTLPIAATSAQKSIITIPKGTVKANPFIPYRNLGDNPVVKDVPTFDLVAPPEVLEESSDAARVMDTIVSGILYDKFSPSAILNIEGNDYLVKKGDVVNNYKIINIMQDSVTVKLGANVYKAGIGEILTEGSLNHNDVSNLSNKFGGKDNELQ